MPATVRQNKAGQSSASRLSASRIAARDWRDRRGFIWFIWSIWSVWFNQTNETNQINKRDQPALALHASQLCCWQVVLGIRLGIGDDMRICFLYPFNLVNLCDHHIREGSFVRDRDE